MSKVSRLRGRAQFSVPIFAIASGLASSARAAPVLRQPSVAEEPAANRSESTSWTPATPTAASWEAPAATAEPATSTSSLR